jgi:uncharacterized protein (DUF1800 family)
MRSSFASISKLLLGAVIGACFVVSSAISAQISPPSASVSPKGRDLLLDLGPSHGIWGYASAKNAWSYIHSQSIKSAIRADVDRNGLADTVIDFGSSSGIWAMLDNGTWKQIHPASAKWVLAGDLDGSGRDDLVVDFGDPVGIWIYRDSTNWIKLHDISSKSAILIDLDHNGRTDLVIDFGDLYGIWAYLNNKTWQQVHGSSARWMLSADIDKNRQDDLVVDFGTQYGIWIRYNNASWVQLHGLSAKSAVAADVTRSGYRDSVFIDFGDQFGIWGYSKATQWAQLHGLSAKGMIAVDTDANQQDDLVIDFGDQFGIWRRSNNANWVPVYGVTSASLAAVALPARNWLDFPATAAEAAKFLAKGTFGPTDAETARVSQLGYLAWIEEQYAKPRAYHGSYWDTENAAILAASGGDRTAFGDQVTNSFWKQALIGDDQLRQRVAFALSEIFVISMADGSIDYWDKRTRGAAGYLDMLGDNSFGNYRTLLESVALHPMMGRYLSHLGNEKEDPDSGRLPDENFAREVMQLFSIGLVQLNLDGTPKLAGGQQIPTYGPADIAGLAKVFTGWGWYGPDTSEGRWYGWVEAADRNYRPMQAYPNYHSTSEKSFLGTTIPAQSVPDPKASLKIALDTLFVHPNVGPFFGKQLIQRLVTSNPSPAYVERVASAFNNNGAGVRGDMKAVIRAVLLDPEARRPEFNQSYGKLREPILRVSAFLRAFNARSKSGKYLVGRTDDPSYGLAQSPLFSPSVFNFYRPGFIPPNTAAGEAGLAVPEMQITNEVSVAGYANYVMFALSNGIPLWGAAQGDIQPNLTELLPLAATPASLVDRINAKLFAGAMSNELKTSIINGVGTIGIPAPTATNSSQVDAAKLNRVRFALWLALASPEFIVQK